MSLNIDIYLMLMDHLDSPSDISALMRSCKTLCTLGAKRLLLPGVTIRSDAALLSFSRFMLRDLAARIPHLRRLFLCIELQRIDDEGSGSVYECDPEIIEEEMLKGGRLLYRVLRRATALEHLAIHFCEELLEREDSLVDALVALKNVRYLHISSYGLLTHEVIAEINSPLAHVIVDCAAGPSHDVHIAQTLARHRQTLEKLTVWHVNLMETFVALDEEDEEIIFPHVHSLCIRSSLALDLAHLIDTFPNVRSLDVVDVHLTGRYSPDDASELRDTNIVSADGWCGLDHLCGDEYSLYILGWTHPVKRLDMEWDNLGWLEAPGPVLDARPTHFMLHCGFASEGEPPLWDLPEEQISASTSITHLGLDVCSSSLSDLTVAVNGGNIMSPLLCFISARDGITFFALRLRALPLETECGFAREDSRYPTSPSVPDDAQRTLLGGIELPLLVRKMADVAPSLRYVSLDLEGHAPSYWQIGAPEEGSGQTAIVPLDREEGEAVVCAEGMEWRCREPEPPRFDEDKMVEWGIPAEEDEWARDEDCEDSESEDDSD